MTTPHCCSCKSPDVFRRAKHDLSLWCWRCSMVAVAGMPDGTTARDLFDDVLVMGEAVFRDADRAGGGVECETCGKLYSRHPNLPDPKVAFLTLLCDGRVVKL